MECLVGDEAEGDAVQGLEDLGAGGHGAGAGAVQTGPVDGGGAVEAAGRVRQEVHGVGEHDEHPREHDQQLKGDHREENGRAEARH